VVDGALDDEGPGVIAGLLAGLAVVALLARPRVRLPRAAPARSSDLRVPGACAVAGVALWVVVGGPLGLALGAGAAVAGPRLIARLDGTESEGAELAATLPLALDLLAACLAGGAAPGAAVEAVAAAFPGPCGRRLERVASSLALGAAPAEAWGALGAARDAAGAAARALARAAEGGAPVAGAVQRVAADARRRQAADAHRRAARAGVLAVLPLGACFLPAFVLLGVVPAVVGLAGPLLSSLA
jgi:pilus assembly protein TadC